MSEYIYIQYIQVLCKCVFSKLKILKTKLMSSISQKHLELLMSLFVEENLIKFIKKDKMIDQLASYSQKLKRLKKLYIFISVPLLQIILLC